MDPLTRFITSAAQDSLAGPAPRPIEVRLLAASRQVDYGPDAKLMREAAETIRALRADLAAATAPKQRSAPIQTEIWRR